MMMTVNEVSKLTGVSVRTLHYYDEIGLLKPAQSTDAGYRLYDGDNLQRLQQILLFRELEFPLNDIKRIIDSPNFSKEHALDDQIELLKMKQKHFADLLQHAEKLREEISMDFTAFDKSKIEDYKKQAKEKWGETAAYKEYETKTASKDDAEMNEFAKELMQIFAEFGEMKNLDPASESVQCQVKNLQDFISEKYYTCTKQILSGLGQMYAAGGEFTENIDKAGGSGTAEFTAKAIEIFCK